MKKLFGGDDDWDSTPADEQGNNPGNPPAWPFGLVVRVEVLRFYPFSLPLNTYNLNKDFLNYDKNKLRI